MKRVVIYFIAALFFNISCKADSLPEPDNSETSSVETEQGYDYPIFVFEGVKEVIKADTYYILNRHSDAMWSRDGIYSILTDRARTQSCIRIRFRTDSRSIEPSFKHRVGTQERLANFFFGFYINGEYKFDRYGDNLKIENLPEGINEIMIVLPIMYGVDFYGVETEPGSKYYKVEKQNKPVYIAIGDSITHGVGQSGCSSVKTYPFVLAEALGYDLYNVAVGACQTSPGLAYEYENIQADYITILWGYNDWNAQKGNLTVIRQRYLSLLENLLKTQKKAKIYCLLPTFSSEESVSGYKATLGEVRQAQREVAESLDSGRIFVIDSSLYTDADGLADKVHFNNSGSVAFGNKLADILKDNSSSKNQ